MGMLQAGIIPVTPFQQNCTLLFDMDSKEGVVVDPGGPWIQLTRDHLAPVIALAG